MWRSKDWENPYHRDLEYYSSELYPATYKTMEDTYEAGADALFNSLRQEGNSRGGRVENDPVFGTGTWLFMSEEE